MGWEKGKGLGKNEDGDIKYLRGKRKKGNEGIGAKKKTDDETWKATQGIFNDLLKRLNTTYPDGKVNGNAEVEESDSGKSMTTSQALKNYTQKKSLYGRFRKA